MATALRTRLFHLWFLISRPMTLGARGLVFDAGGRVMLVKHTYVPKWHLPGGGVEKGETAVECLVRELGEEANVELDSKPRLFGFYFNRQVQMRDHVAVYVCDGAKQTGEKKPDREIAAARFFDLDNLPEDISPATLRRIDEWRSGGRASDVW
ncbi:MAG: NUDIX domain-containing protein [Pseudomonadota bacterium]